MSEDPRDWWRRMADEERARPLLGSAARPYDLVIPAWLAARCEEQGETAQEVADRIFRPHVNVVVLEPLP